MTAGFRESMTPAHRRLITMPFYGSKIPCVTGKPAGSSSDRRRIAGCSFATWPPRCWSTARIETTLAKAKEVQPFAEKLITLAKDGWNLNNFRRVLAVVTKKDVAFKLFKEIGPRFKGRPGGYTRIYKLAKVRQGDAAPMAVIALLGEDEKIKAPTRPSVV